MTGSQNRTALLITPSLGFGSAPAFIDVHRAGPCGRPSARALDTGLGPAALPHDREQPPPPYAPGPAPDLPGVLPLPDREEDDLRAPDQILERHVSDCGFHPAVGGVVAVIAHHEVVPGGHHVFLRVVVESVVDQIERRVTHPIGQRFAPALDARRAAALLGLDIVVGPLALHRYAVDVEHAFDHLDAVTR